MRQKLTRGARRRGPLAFAVLALGALALAPERVLAQPYPPAGATTVDPVAPPPQPYPPTAAPGFDPGAPPPQPPPPVAASAVEEPAVHFVLFGGYDIGSTNLVSASMSDGSSQEINANQGLSASVGIATLKLLGGKLATQATVGIKGWSINAQNGDVQWRAYPLDLMEFAYLDPIRLGAGISLLLSPSLTGSGAASAVSVEFKDSLGLALEADWVFRVPGARRARFTVGGRYLWQKLEASSGGPAIDASSFAFLMGYTG